jgi:hypothetical protein
VAYAHQVATLARLVSDATLRAGFAGMAGDENAEFPDFFELKGKLDEWLVSTMDLKRPSKKDSEQNAIRASLGLEARQA